MRESRLGNILKEFSFNGGSSTLLTSDLSQLPWNQAELSFLIPFINILLIHCYHYRLIILLVIISKVEIIQSWWKVPLLMCHSTTLLLAPNLQSMQWRLHSPAVAGWGWHRTSGTAPATRALARSRSLDQARAAGSASVCHPQGLMWEPVQTQQTADFTEHVRFFVNYT